MRLKIGLNITRNYSINFNIPKRQKNKIKFIIIHYTGMKNESAAIKKLCDTNSKVSSHYFIKNNGHILNLVPDLYEAWHAGKSKWKNYSSLNQYSIGIEINNPGHDHGYNNFKLKQIFSVVQLLKYLTKKYNIKNKNILGHSDIAPDRKKDPGEKFPWKKLAQNRLCHWHKLNQARIKKFRGQKLPYKDENNFIKNLYKIGYSKIINKKIDNNNLFIVKAFQRKFRQDLISGEIDKECFLISKNLLKS